MEPTIPLLAESAGMTVIIDGVTYVAAAGTGAGHQLVEVSALPAGLATDAGLAAILAQLDSKTSTLAKESGGNLAAILAQLDSKTSTLAKEAGGNLAAILAKLDVALSTRALEAGGNLATLTARHAPSSLVWAIKSPYRERKNNTDAAAGSNTVGTTVVSANEIWVITNVAMWDADHAITTIDAYVYDGAAISRIGQLQAPAAGQSLDRQGWWPLATGWAIYGIFSGCTLHDSLFIDIAGFKMGLT